jgi:hypothetical protein
MKMMARITASLFGAALALTGTGTVGNANGAKFEPLIGDDYLTQCMAAPRNTVEDMLAAHCNGYVEAAVTFIVLMNGVRYCIPLDTSPQDVLDATVAFLRAHPDNKQYLFASVMLAAVEAKWPCK